MPDYELALNRARVRKENAVKFKSLMSLVYTRKGLTGRTSFVPGGGERQDYRKVHAGALPTEPPYVSVNKVEGRPAMFEAPCAPRNSHSASLCSPLNI